MHDLGAGLARRPSFSADGAWLAAGGTLVHLDSGQRLTLTPALDVSIFLPDGTIAAAAAHEGRIRLYCPSRP